MAKKHGGGEIGNENRRHIFENVLGTDLLFKIRFPLIDSEEFVREIGEIIWENFGYYNILK